MNAGTERIYEELRRVARSEDVTYYSCVAPLVGLDMDLLEDRNRIANILDRISTTEHQAGRPLLSAVVIRKDKNMPGRGFFNLARRLRLHDANNDFQYWFREIRSVHTYWSEQETRG